MYITIIVALITAIAAILAPVASAWITQRGAYKIEYAKLFFAEKADAYKEFLRSADKYSSAPSAENLSQLQKASNNALLFSSLDTQAKISDFGKQLLTSRTKEDLQRLTAAQLSVLSAMQKELNVYQGK